MFNFASLLREIEREKFEKLKTKKKKNDDVEFVYDADAVDDVWWWWWVMIDDRCLEYVIDNRNLDVPLLIQLCVMNLIH